MSPEAGCPGALVELTGTNFGEVLSEGDGVEMRQAPGTWLELPIYSWADDRIVVEIPAWTFSPGNKRIKVFTGVGSTVYDVFTLYDCASPKAINGNSNPAFDDGPCRTMMTLTNGTGAFGANQDIFPTVVGGDTGVYHTVEVVSSQGTYVAWSVSQWSNAQVRVNFRTFFEDLNGNYLPDVGEPMIPSCSGMGLGTYSVYLKYIFYGDDGSVAGVYDDADTIFQVETSNPVTFELTNEPYIRALNPVKASKASRTRVRVLGGNFGPTQTTGEVRVGSRNQYNTDPLNKGKLQTRIKLWSSTKIAFRLRVNINWVGKPRYVWVVKDGQVSNKTRLEILP
jgi:hypothetical protein